MADFPLRTATIQVASLGVTVQRGTAHFAFEATTSVLLDELGELLRERDALRDALFEALGNLSESELRVQMLERDLAQLRASTAIEKHPTRRKVSSGIAISLIGLLATGVSTADRVITAEINAGASRDRDRSNAEVAKIKQMSTADRLRSVEALAHQLASECSTDEGKAGAH